MLKHILTIIVLICSTTCIFAQDDAVDKKIREIFVYGVKDLDHDRIRKKVQIEEIDEDDRNDSLIVASELEYPGRFEGSRIFAFKSKAQLKSFMDKYLTDKRPNMVYEGRYGSDMEYIYLDAKTFIENDGVVAIGEIDGDGKCELLAPDNCYFCIISAMLDNDINNYDGSNFIDMGTDEATIFVRIVERTLKGVEKSIPVKGTVSNGPFPAAPGSKIFGEFYWVKEREADSDHRIGVIPICYEITPEDTLYDFDEKLDDYDVFKIIAPAILDGESFHKEQMKRLGYNLVKNDPVGRYIIDDRLMHTNVSDTIKFSDTIRVTKEGHHYPVIFEIHEYSKAGEFAKHYKLADAGRDIEPMRFIKFNMANSKIERERYIKKPKTNETISDSLELNLYFQVGKSELYPGDTLGWNSLNRLKNHLEGLRRNPYCFPGSTTITGYASPEGDYNSNARLAHNRAMYLAHQVDGKFGNARVENPVVQPWTVVADTLERMERYADADAVRTICSQVKDMNQQYQRIRSLECYDYIKEHVLEKLRIDIISFSYTMKRAKTEKEVYNDFDAEPETYFKGEGVQAYEYYFLMNKYQDSLPVLEKLAQAAYDHFKDDFEHGRDEFGRDRNRPWSLAAYHLARCKIEKKDWDSTILKPFLDPQRLEDHFGVLPPGQKRQNNIWNDPALALLQIQMLCGLREYYKALFIYQNCVNKKYKMGTMNGKYPEVGNFLECYVDPSKIYQNQAVKGIIMNSSEWNKVMVLAAQCKHMGSKNALGDNMEAEKMLKDPRLKKIFPEDDPRILYTKALLRLNIKKGGKNLRDEKFNVQVFKEGNKSTDGTKDDYGHFMVQCLKKDPSFWNILKWDGMFPIDYYKKCREFFKQEAKKAKPKAAAAMQETSRQQQFDDDTEI